MDTIFVNSEDSKTSLNLSDEINLKMNNKYVVLFKTSHYSTWKNIKDPQKNNKFKILA